MKRIGCLTFHASHNYGSCLQAFALKKAIESMSKDVCYEIINYRNPVQKSFYRSEFEKKDKKSIYSRIFLIGFEDKIKVKHELFEDFIINELQVKEEMTDISQLGESVKTYDTVIVGSDQIWNNRAFEYTDAYFLPYTRNGGRRFTYAVSIGSKDNIVDNDLKIKLRPWILEYEELSVRDQRTKDFLIQVAGDSITNKLRFDCDPTLLLSKERWFELINTASIDLPKEKYILFYDLSRNKENWDIAYRLSKQLHMPLVITSIPFPRVIHKSIHKSIIRQYEVGPKEWLKLIVGAELVLSSSFHGMIFSLLLDKPFYSLNTRTDNRVSFFLNLLDLSNRIVDSSNASEINTIPSVLEQSAALDIIERMKSDSLSYIKRIIET